MRHLTVRVAWHDSGWQGRVCAAPAANAHCLSLDRVRALRDDARETALAGLSLADLPPGYVPPCLDEATPFMNAEPWTHEFHHPYEGIPAVADTHGHLTSTRITVPPYSTFARPFAWMLDREQESIAERLPDPLPPAGKAPFPTPWVFGAQRQVALLDHVFGQVKPSRSLVMFYVKDGHPLDEHHNRLLAGIGTVDVLDSLRMYATRGSGPDQPMWDRLFSHSIRPDGFNGFVIPYGAYLRPTGDRAEDARRRDLAESIAVAAAPAHVRLFSYAAELAGPDVALAVLTRALEAVRSIRAHGIAPGPWEQREDWINAQIAAAWADRGSYPGLGATLEGMGLRLGTSLVRELLATGDLNPEEDPWPLIAAILEGRTPSPRTVYAADVAQAGRIWSVLPQARRDFMHVLSRLDLTTEQATRWLSLEGRDASTRSVVSDVDVLANPYRIAEVDLGGDRSDRAEGPVTIGTIDRGLLGGVAAPTPPPLRPALTGANDPRRIRAALVTVLRDAAAGGDTLLAETDAIARVASLDLSVPLVLPPYALDAASDLDVEITRGSVTDPDAEQVGTLQLNDRTSVATTLTRRMLGRASKVLPSLGADWQKLLREAIGDALDPGDERHAAALAEQAAALEVVTTRRLSALTGSAGTGKTSVLGALLRYTPIVGEGVLLLAPTGKARVRLTQAAAGEAMTVAQFLYHQGRYDGVRQRPTLDPDVAHRGTGPYTGKRTVVIDEASMLTEDELAAVMAALDLGFVQRIILVGDPNQLPPIGPGRPFADLVACLTSAAEAADGTPHRAADGALAHLSVQLRAAGGSAALALAGWFTGDAQPFDADQILSELDGGEPTRGSQLAKVLPGGIRQIGDLELVYWKDPTELRAKLLDALGRHLGATDTAGLDRALHLNGKMVPFDDHSGSERFQVLSPVRMGPHGVVDLNRVLQAKFRSAELHDGREHHRALGHDEIVIRDKVICLKNGWHHVSGPKATRKSEYLANGEVGLVARVKARTADYPAQWAVAVAHREGQHAYFEAGTDALELAYALTVHKAQGSEFESVFVVVPAASRPLSRELVYTALTRSKTRLVLLIEGADPSPLLSMSSPERSETARRNTNLFNLVAVRRPVDDVPFADHLRHRAADGTLVRSKSEVVIMNRILERFGPGVFTYERPLIGTATGDRKLPDFTAVTDAGDTLVLEHLGMLDQPGYAARWADKKAWYEHNGFVEGVTLFRTDEIGGLSTAAIDAVLDEMATALDA